MEGPSPQRLDHRARPAGLPASAHNELRAAAEPRADMADHAAPAPLTVALVLGSDQVEAIARRVAELLRPEPAAPASGATSPSPLMTPAEAAAFLRRPRQYVYDSILKGRFTAKGTRARRLLLRAEVEAHAEGVDYPAREGGSRPTGRSA